MTATTMKSTGKAMILCLAVTFIPLGITSSLASPAGDRSPHNRVIGRAPAGEVSTSFVARLAPDGFGYLTFIAGYDGPVFSSETVQDEATAYFTFYSPDSGAPAKVFERGNLQVVQLSGAPAGDIFFYFDDTPDGDFDHPETFSDGELIGVTTADTYFLKTDLNSGTGMTTNTSRHRQLSSGTFHVDGKTYQFRRPRDRLRLLIFFSLDPEVPGALDFAGEELFLGAHRGDRPCDNTTGDKEEPVEPELVRGDFMVAGASRRAGALCPVDE